MGRSPRWSNDPGRGFARAAIAYEYAVEIGFDHQPHIAVLREQVEG
jgi:hypothetical protein